MKTTVKKNLIIFHSVREFEELHHRLFEEHGRATMLVSWRMKRKLGFTIRHHKGLVPYLEKYGNPMGNPLTAGDSHSNDLLKKFTEENKHKMAHEDQIHLDFWNEASMSFFMLKYLNN